MKRQEHGEQMLLEIIDKQDIDNSDIEKLVVVF
jgi:ankyrin repeat protein